MKTAIVIPVRLDSSRIKRKALIDICGKSLVQRVFEQAVKSNKAKNVFVLTDSEEIREHCQGFAKNILFSDVRCDSGTDRIARVVSELDYNFIVNLQCDEPLINPNLIDQIINFAEKSKSIIVSAMTRIHFSEDLENENVVKVVVDKYDYAMYFSRSKIPFSSNNDLVSDFKYWKHIGVYCYSKRFLQDFLKLEPTDIEKNEKLEQLRFLVNGFKVKMLKTNFDSVSVDSYEDLKKVKYKILNEKSLL